MHPEEEHAVESGIHGPGSAGRGGDAPHSCAAPPATEEVKPVLTQLPRGPHSDTASAPTATSPWDHRETWAGAHPELTAASQHWGKAVNHSLRPLRKSLARAAGLRVMSKARHL